MKIYLIPKTLSCHCEIFSTQQDEFKAYNQWHNFSSAMCQYAIAKKEASGEKAFFICQPMRTSIKYDDKP